MHPDQIASMLYAMEIADGWKYGLHSPSKEDLINVTPVNLKTYKPFEYTSETFDKIKDYILNDQKVMWELYNKEKEILEMKTTVTVYEPIPEFIELSDLSIGDCFCYKTGYFVKTNGHTDPDVANAMCLQKWFYNGKHYTTGDLMTFSPMAKVIWKSMEILIGKDDD